MSRMCDYIPFDIQAEILKRLPIESLIRFRSVSKAWKSLIGSSEFINDHYYVHQAQTQAQAQHLLCIYEVNADPACVSFIDDDTFPNHRFSLIVPEALKQLDLSVAYRSSHGVVGTLGLIEDPDLCMAVLWNPIVKKSVGIVIPGLDSSSDSHCLLGLGFGVCPNTNDVKIVKIIIPEKPCVHWEIQVFTLSSRAWKSLSINPPSKLCHFEGQVPIEGFVYWLGSAELVSPPNFIIYFDLTSEEFGEVCLPDNLVHAERLAIYKRNESLVVLEYCDERVCDVWMMKDCVTKSLTKMFSFKLLFARTVLGFRMNGEAITEMKLNDHDETYTLEVYDSCSRHFNAIGVQGDYFSFYVSSYTGSLLLLDQSDSIIH